MDLLTLTQALAYYHLDKFSQFTLIIFNLENKLKCYYRLLELAGPDVCGVLDVLEAYGQLTLQLNTLGQAEPNSLQGEINQSIALLLEFTEQISYNIDRIVSQQITLTECGAEAHYQFHFPICPIQLTLAAGLPFGLCCIKSEIEIVDKQFYMVYFLLMSFYDPHIVAYWLHQRSMCLNYGKKLIKN